MFYELRMYRTTPGRVGDVAARMDKLVPPVFEKYGFGPRLGEWICTAGSMMPCYIWILRWDSQEQRAKAYSGIYGDAEWNKVRALTNGPNEMVLGMDTYMLNQTAAGEAAWKMHAGLKGRAGGLHEMRMLEVYPGKGGDAQKRLIDIDLPALKKAGGVTLGLFDVTIGRGMASYVWFTAWDSYEARNKGWAKYAKTPAVQKARAQEVADVKTHYVGRHDTWLLEPTKHNGPRYNFAQK